ncbi:MAG: hypothetical protein GY855_04220 [candidate division Zixibacteria bacterium]|nr:hypothetical protein [candidate division Zixibacteria bacterium]
MKAPRIHAIDIGRGIAMSFVFLAHAAWILSRSEGVYFITKQQLSLLYHLATPSFLLISGAMLGYLYYSSSKDQFYKIKKKLRSRGILLISVIHILIIIAKTIEESNYGEFYRAVLITDIIGIVLLIYLFLIPRIKIRLYYALILFIISWIIPYIWYPQNQIILFIKHFLFGRGIDEGRVLLGPMVLIPLAAIYHCGVVVGKHLSIAVREEKISTFINRIFWWGLLSSSLSMIIIASKRLFFSAEMLNNPVFQTLFSLARRSPPSIFYPFWFGGISLILLAGLLWYEQRFISFGYWGAVFKVFGRTSLFTFVCQAHVYTWFHKVAGIETPISDLSWIIYYTATFIILWVSSFLWLRYFMKLPSPFKEVK